MADGLGIDALRARVRWQAEAAARLRRAPAGGTQVRSLTELERLLDAGRAQREPILTAELQHAVLALRDYASTTGVLPPEFTGLLEELCAQARPGRPAVERA